MTNRQTSRLKMLRAVIALCIQYPNIVAIIAAFQAAAAKLGTFVTAIDAEMLVEEQSTTVITSSKDRLRALLAKLAADVAGALYAWASSVGDDEVKMQVDYPETILAKMKEEKLVTTTTRIFDLAVGHQGEIDPFGITPNIITSLEDTVKAFSTALPSPRNAQARKKAAKGQIVKLMKDTDVLLTEQMDKTVRLLKKDHADFYSEYRTNRKIVNPATKHTSVKGLMTDEATGAPLYKAIMEIEALELVVYTDLSGAFDSGKIKHGVYNIKAGATGFATQVFENVEVKLGRAVRIDVALVSEATEMTKVA